MRVGSCTATSVQASGELPPVAAGSTSGRNLRALHVALCGDPGFAEEGHRVRGHVSGRPYDSDGFQFNFNHVIRLPCHVTEEKR